MTRQRLAAIACLAIVGGCHPSAFAAITCTASSPGFFSVYDALTTVPNDNVASFTLSCSRTTRDPTVLNYIAFTDDGLYNNGRNNRARISSGAATYLQYDFWTSSTYSTNWSNSSRCVVGQVNFGTSTFATDTRSYYSRLPAQQTSPLGTYLDTVTINFSYNRTACATGATTNASTAFGVTISNLASCQIATPPGTVAFTYTAFQNTPAPASTSYQVRCTSGLPYTMALDSYVNVISGLRYSLTLSASSGTGNGALQGYTITGSMEAKQAGTCATSVCTATQPRSLIVTY